MSKEFLPADLLETTLGIQSVIDQSPPETQDQLGNDFANFWQDPALFRGSYKVEIHGKLAYYLPDGLTKDAEDRPLVRFFEPRVRAMLANIFYARIGDKPLIMWMVANPNFRYLHDSFDAAAAADFKKGVNPIPMIEPGVATKRPLYFPVSLIESVMVAA